MQSKDRPLAEPRPEQIRIARQWIGEYQGEIPLTHFLRNRFRALPAAGSRDRRILRNLLFSEYRWGDLFPETDTEQHLSKSYALAETLRKSLPKYLPGTSLREWNLAEGELFPPDHAEYYAKWLNLFSKDLNLDEFLLAQRIQPLTWIRLRLSRIESCIDFFQKQSMPYYAYPGFQEALAFQADIDPGPFQHELGFEFQDLMSQASIRDVELSKGMKVYDCCAGSGGKSLSLVDREPAIRLTVSDNRNQILFNLEKRFLEQSSLLPRIVEADLSQGPPPGLETGEFDHIIADLPCSGSGTWSREPEAWRFRSPESIAVYAGLQRNILQSVLPLLKPGGKLTYITCSVFAAENEEQVPWILAQANLQCTRSGILQGSSYRADTMFRAEFVKPA